ncbi:MAG: hypothetical protein IPK25_16555 [Saprospiraceae bacterium]|nr:hypothetical protein [Saprospiraceae bacterium]
MLGENEISKYTSELTLSARSIIANIGKEGEPGSVNETVRQLEIISKNMAALTASANRLVETNARSNNGWCNFRYCRTENYLTKYNKNTGQPSRHFTVR